MIIIIIAKIATTDIKQDHITRYNHEAWQPERGGWKVAPEQTPVGTLRVR